MLPKPTHLGPQYGAQFQDPAIIAAYHHRPPYPAEVFAILAGLITHEPRTALDIGCGTGDIARRLAAMVERVDAVDISAGMIAKGKALPGGDDPRLHWIVGRVEDAPLQPPYALVAAGESLHWMDWAVVLPRLREALAPEGYLAIVEREEEPMPWAAETSQVLGRYSTNREFRPYHLVDELEQRGLFERRGEQRTPPMRFVQSVASYVECVHSRNGFSRDRMGAEDAAVFDTALGALVSRSSADGMVELRIVGHVCWGVPRAPFPRGKRGGS
jgi:SAM-dependent methyltransferase